MSARRSASPTCSRRTRGVAAAMARASSTAAADSSSGDSRNDPDSSPSVPSAAVHATAAAITSEGVSALARQKPVTAGEATAAMSVAAKPSPLTRTQSSTGPSPARGCSLR